MLTNLFGGDANDGGAWGPNSNSPSGNKVLQTPDPRDTSPSNLCGIQNQGATCYLNSLIQTLLFTPEFRDAVFSISDIGETRPADGSRSIPEELQRLFASLLLIDQCTVKTTDLTDSFGWTNNEALSQHDVQELNKLLCEAIEDSLTGTNSSSLINEIYRGAIVNQICCTVCDYKSERVESYLDLTIPVSGYHSLTEALTDLYLNVEQLTGNNQYKCDRCQKLVDANKGAKIKELPPILTICIQRLAFDLKTLSRRKETSKFVFPFELSMSAFLDDELPSLYTDYELFSVVVHRGGAHGGHYFTLIKDIDQLGYWNKSAEGQCVVKRIQKKQPFNRQVSRQKSYTGSALELIKSILLQYSPGEFLPVESLSMYIQTTTGVSWTKSHKKKQGSIAKFLMAHSKDFLYDSSTRSVQLIHHSDTGTALTQTTEIHEENISLFEQQNEEQQTEEQPTTVEHSSEDHWFLFDDRKIQQIDSGGVEKYFQGKESAYMLYYRRKLLTRPQESHSNPKYLIPEKILDEIDVKNQQIRESRVNEEQTRHTVTINVYSYKHYHIDDFYIKTRDDTDHIFAVVEIDGRLSSDVLLTQIYSQIDEDISELSALTVQSLSAHGINILHPLSNIEGECSVSDIFNDKYTGILLFNKTDLEKCGVPIGDALQPTIIGCCSESGSQILVLHPALSISDIYELASSRFASKVSGLCYGDGRPLESSDDLAHSILSTGDFLTATMADLNSTDILLHVQLLDDTTSSLHVPKTQTIGELCERFAAENVRLRRLLGNGALSPPLRTNLRLQDVGLASGSNLKLENGHPINRGEILLTFNVENREFEMVTKPSRSVKDCIHEMMNISKLQFSRKYYMRKTDWAGDPSEKITAWESDLESVGITHGDKVILNEGEAITREMWNLSAEIVSAERLDFVTSLTKHLKDVTLPENVQELVRVCDLEISPDCTIEELKELVKSTVNDKFELECRYVRLRLLQNGRAGKLLKNENVSVRKSRIKNKTSLVVEIQEQPDDLSDHTLLLELRVKSDEGLYGTFDRFIWDISSGATLTHLKTSLSQHLKTEREHLHVSKYNTVNNQWTQLQNTQNTAAKKKRGESALTKPPHSLQDMDILAVIISAEPVTQTDFITSQNEQIDHILKQQAECRQKRKQSRKTDVLDEQTDVKGDNSKPRQKEAVLTIKRRTNCLNINNQRMSNLNNGQTSKSATQSDSLASNTPCAVGNPTNGIAVPSSTDSAPVILNKKPNLQTPERPPSETLNNGCPIITENCAHGDENSQQEDAGCVDLESID